MEDLILNAEAEVSDLYTIPIMVVGVRDAFTLSEDGVFETLSLEVAAERISKTPHLLINRVLTAKRLGLPRIIAFDVLELYAFVRPARFCLPTLSGLLNALTLNDTIESDDDACLAIQKAAERLLDDICSETYRYREGAVSVATMMAKAGWPWGVYVLSAFAETKGANTKRERDGLAVWHLLEEWEDNIPPPPAGDEPVLPEESKSRLAQILGTNSESREAQVRYSAAATHAFKPRELVDGPNLQILEAGTGTGKTLGYIAPASVWAEKNDAPVWLATYTKNLQRQLDQELSKLFPDPVIKSKRAVIRKGRENYACLLNIEETLRAVMMRGVSDRASTNMPVIDSDKVLMGLVTRWARFSRDGDMIGGDFPSWLGGHFGLGRIAGLTDRRSECLYSGCQHFRKCFIEKVNRKARHADLVVANHALVMAQAAMAADDPDSPKRFVFDEGHHVFDAADSAFSTHLSGMEGAELRRWLRGKESGGSTRARGIQNRIEELIADDQEAQELMKAVIKAAHILPTDNWLGRVASAAPSSRFETFLMKVREQVMARSDALGPYGLEVSTADPVEGLTEAGLELQDALLGLSKPMLALAAKLLNKLDEEADSLDSSSRGRLDSSARSLKLRADMVSLWASMAEGIGQKTPDDFVDWFSVERFDGRERDIGMHRHFIDPSKPFAEVVLERAHGVVITSATLRDRGDKAIDSENDESWKSADARVGLEHISIAPKRLMVPSPFDYKTQTKFLIVTDVNKMDAEQVASAYRGLFLASNGGALGLFTAISRLRATYDRLAPPLDDMGIDLYAQHVDPIDTATLVDIFRENTDSCLLGTDAVRDGVDVPGNSLRLIVFDRVPWPRPTILHRARRAHFGGRHYDEMLTRLKVAQAFGRLVRRADDRGAFVMLDGQTPSRILEGLPDGVEPLRVGLKDAIQIVKTMTENNSDRNDDLT
ncbi:ATP-dependent DNA helicase [Kordiimonas sp. SCSIO 12610]|uniref:ATP-dependent DNA helicase n=1 Tax=Kordiimonas sp. SCSIO 12610 TaxID=2829597 RepID=UPI0021096680|nr:ATP-dependent DNA helicase [Kordiimonas sp. SCSIO 12610]UTW55495.1 ATP-dependent DNA helicase [Kordiimonas sp. SCSIO 12610]